MEPVLEWCAVNQHHLPEHFFHLHGIVKMFASYYRIGKLLLDRYIIFHYQRSLSMWCNETSLS